MRSFTDVTCDYDQCSHYRCDLVKEHKGLKIVADIGVWERGGGVDKDYDYEIPSDKGSECYNSPCIIYAPTMADKRTRILSTLRKMVHSETLHEPTNS